MTPISATQFTVVSSLTSANDDSLGSCGGGGRDLAFSFVVAQQAEVSFTITSIGGTSTPVGYLRRDDCTTELRCNSGTSPSTPVTLQPGSYRLIVDSSSQTATGSFTATVTVSPPPSLVGDDCSTAEVLTLTSGSTSVRASTDGFTQSVLSSACTVTGPDRYYTFTLPTTTAELTATVTPSTGSLASVTLLGPSTFASCGSATEFACGQSATAGAVGTFTATSLTAGTYFIVVKNLGPGAGAFTLDVSVVTGSTPGGTCAAPNPLVFVNNTATVTSSTSGRTNTFPASTICNSVSGPDVVYSFAVTAGQSVTAVLTPSSTYRGALVLSGPNPSCNAAAEVDCLAATASGAAVSLTATPVSAGTYYLWVDGVSGSSGTFSLSVTLSGGTAPTGESCADPIPLSFSSGTTGTATASGTTATARNDRTFTCGGSGPDRVYSFTINGTRSLTATLTPAPGFPTPVLALTGPNATCLAAPELTCVGPVPLGALSRVLTAGTYYLWVDVFGTAAGSYSLSATLN